MKDPLFNDRYYWPAVIAFLDKRAGLNSSYVWRNVAAPKSNGVEVW